jgi:hypothetical protein
MFGLDVDLNGNIVVTGKGNYNSLFFSKVNGKFNSGNARAFSIYFEVGSNRIKWYKEIYDPSANDFLNSVSPSFSFDGSLIVSTIPFAGALYIQDS